MIRKKQKMYQLAKLLGLALIVWAIMVHTSSSPNVSADLQSNLDWCMSNSGAINQAYPSNFTYEKCAALAQLYEDTNGDNWTFNTWWFADVNMCDWHGIDCAYGPASFINLDDNNLSGAITDLASFWSINWFYVDGNNITSINLSGAVITSLWIWNNPISSIDLTNINQNIVDIYMRNTDITSIDISGLTWLWYLYLPNWELNYFNTSAYTWYTSIYAFYINNNNLCEENLSDETIAFLDHFQSTRRDTQTCDDPYEINTCEELQGMQDDLGWNYTLGNNIDCSDTVNRNNGSGFIPVGSPSTPFTWSLDWSWYAINDLYIQVYEWVGTCDDETNYVGLFGYVQTGSLSNIDIIDSYTVWCNYVWALVWYMDSWVIDNVHVSGYNRPWVWTHGWLIAWLINETLVSNSSSEWESRGSGIYIWWLIGRATSNSTVSWSNSSARVDGWEKIWWLVGWLDTSTILNSYAAGDVYADASTDDNYRLGKAWKQAWWLIWYAIQSNIIDSYALGNVQWDTDSIWWLIGEALNTTIENVYANGTVSGQVAIGWLIGILSDSDVSYAYALGNVQWSNGDIWWLVGYSYNNSIAYVYSIGSTTGGNYAWWLIGNMNDTDLVYCYSLWHTFGDNTAGSLIWFSENGTVIQCFSAWNVTGNANIWWLVGLNNSLSTTFTHVYGDDTLRWLYDENEWGTWLTTSEMKNINTYLDAWRDISINDTEVYNNGYPIMGRQIWNDNYIRFINTYWFSGSNSDTNWDLIDDFESGDFSFRNRNNGDPTYPWTIVSDEVYSGNYAARAANSIPANWWSSPLILTYEFDQAGSVYFWVKVSSEDCCDGLQVAVNWDDVSWDIEDYDWYDQRYTINTWRKQLSFPVPAWEIDITFAYVKDWSVTQGQDTAWIDEITFIPDLSPFEWCDIYSWSINIPYQECIGLAHLYTETDWNNRSENDGWFDDLDISNWEANSCYTPEDRIIDRLWFDRCDESDFFDADGFERAIVLTGAGPIYNVYAINLSANSVQGAIQSWMIYFPELRIIDIQDNASDDQDLGITAINVTQNPLLEIMDISDENDYDPRILDLSNNPLLWALNVDDLYLESIDLSNNTWLIYIDIDGNELTWFDTSGLMYMEYLDLNDNNIESFTSYAPNLKYLHADNNGLIDINVENSPLITYLGLSDNNIESIDISALTDLIYLDADYNGLYEIIAAVSWAYQNFNYIDVNYNGLCNISNSNAYDLLNSYADEDWLNYQYFCPIRNLAISDTNDSITLSWNSPKANWDDSEENSNNVIKYTIAWTPGDGENVIYLGTGDYDDYWEGYYGFEYNEQHNWSHTIDGISPGIYTFTVCAVHANEGPARSICSEISYNKSAPQVVSTSSGSPRSSRSSSNMWSTSNLQSRTFTAKENPLAQETQVTEKTDDTKTTTNTNTNSNSSSSTEQTICLDTEYQDAYLFAFQYSITTMPSCAQADMDGTLIRAHAAKMMTNYAMNVLNKTPDTDKACIFDDMQDQTEELQNYAILACQLGLMGLASDGVTPASSFNPDRTIDKAQFTTILSRLLYGPQYDNNQEEFRIWHVQAMQDANIITSTTDLFDPLRRAFAMIMLMRAQK